MSDKQYTHMLSRLESTGNSGSLRTKTMHGNPEGKPEIGKPFAIFGTALSNYGNARMIQTSRVTSIHGNIFTTETGSTYQIEEI